MIQVLSPPNIQYSISNKRANYVRFEIILLHPDRDQEIHNSQSLVYLDALLYMLAFQTCACITPHHW